MSLRQQRAVRGSREAGGRCGVIRLRDASLHILPSTVIHESGSKCMNIARMIN